MMRCRHYLALPRPRPLPRLRLLTLRVPGANKVFRTTAPSGSSPARSRSDVRIMPSGGDVSGRMGLGEEGREELADELDCCLGVGDGRVRTVVIGSM